VTNDRRINHKNRDFFRKKKNFFAEPCMSITISIMIFEFLLLFFTLWNVNVDVTNKTEVFFVILHIIRWEKMCSGGKIFSRIVIYKVPHSKKECRFLRIIIYDKLQRKATHLSKNLTIPVYWEFASTYSEKKFIYSIIF